MDHPQYNKPKPSSVDALVEDCYARVVARLGDSRLEPELCDAFLAYWQAMRRAAVGRSNASSSVCGLFLMVARSEACPIDEALLDAAAGCHLYVTAISVFDAIQDQELEGQLARFGDAVATNAALVMFMQALDGIWRLWERCPPALHRRLRTSLVARSLVSGAGQHRDLRAQRPSSVQVAISTAQDKTEAIAMTAELAALAAGCEPDRVQTYYQIGRDSALIRQCANDLKDLFGRPRSGDLDRGIWNIPLVAAWHGADPQQRRELDILRAEPPASMDRLRALLFETGAMHTVATEMERARVAIHEAIEHLGLAQAPIAGIADLADVTTSRIYGRGGQHDG